MTVPNADPAAVATVDARGLDCPQPVLLARQALRSATAGEVIQVLATDPHAQLDFEAFCARTGHRLLVSDCRDDGTLRFLIRCVAAPDTPGEATTGG
ncbi:MAG: sulfurtransferase TusA family protein [Pseudomonadota bacterium]